MQTRPLICDIDFKSPRNAKPDIVISSLRIPKIGHIQHTIRRLESSPHASLTFTDFVDKTESWFVVKFKFILIFQWLGTESVHQALEGRLLLIHLLCKYNARHIQVPLVIFSSVRSSKSGYIRLYISICPCHVKVKIYVVWSTQSFWLKSLGCSFSTLLALSHIF